MRIAQWVGAICGVWLMAAPAAFGYVDTAAEDVHRTVGPLLATVAVIALWSVVRDVRWVNLALALGLVLAPLVSGHPAEATAVALVTAAVVAATTPFGGRVRRRYGSGWRGVLHGGGGP